MRRLTILTGHYGSGKSEVAVNLAFQKKITTLVDLDVINPYFRSRSVAAWLHEHGITCVESTLEGRQASDLPYVSGKAWTPVIDERQTALYDCAGTAHGVKLLKQVDRWPEDTAFYIVINTKRPETARVDDIVVLMRHLESASGLTLGGIIHNTHLLQETTERMIDEGQALLDQVTRITQVPIVYTVYHHTLTKSSQWHGETIALKRYIGEMWLQGGNPWPKVES